MELVNNTAARVYEYIKEYREKESMSPTYREIAKGLGMSSTSLVSHYLDQLEADGLIFRNKKIPRGIIPLSGDNGHLAAS